MKISKISKFCKILFLLAVATANIYAQPPTITFLTNAQVANSIAVNSHSGLSSNSAFHAVIGEEITVIGANAFANRPNLLTVTFEAESKLQTIGVGAFIACTSLTTITIPASVQTIGDQAFMNCSNLVTVDFEAGSQLQTIGQMAFSSCSLLTSITIPAGVTEIGWLAFMNCAQLATVNFLRTTPPILDNVFQGLPANYEINVPLGSFGTYYNTTVGGWTAPVKARIVIPTNPTITFNQTQVASAAAVNTRLEEFFPAGSGTGTNNTIRQNAFIAEIEAGVASIGFRSFENTALTSITIPTSVTEIGSYAFYVCRDLTTVTFASGSNLQSISTGAFYVCRALTSINIPASVTSISTNAFRECSSLVEITIPAGVTSIAANVFQECSSLVEINIPAGVTSIGSEAFGWCVNLATVTFEGNSVISIGNSAFTNCRSLVEITLPESVTSIGSSAFMSCQALTAINIPAGVTTITPSSFRSTGLTSITIPSGVTTIGTSAFWNCSSLVSISIPESVTSISEYAFNSCIVLSSITLPSGITSIGNYTFANCSSLVSVSIPANVTSIGSDAFRYCVNLATVNFLGTIPPTLGNTTVFPGASVTNTITVPAGSYIAYMAMSTAAPDNWLQNIKNRIIMRCTLTVTPVTNVTVTATGTGVTSTSTFPAEITRNSTNHSEPVTLAASHSSPNYRFVGWRIGTGAGTLISTNTTTTIGGVDYTVNTSAQTLVFPLRDHTTVEAVFAEQVALTVTNGDVSKAALAGTVTLLDGVASSVTLGTQMTVDKGSEVELVLSNFAECYGLDAWQATAGTPTISKSANTYTFDIEETTSLTATFDIQDINLEVDYHSGHGSVSIDGTAVASGTEISRVCGTSVTLVASPLSGHTFMGWSIYPHATYITNSTTGFTLSNDGLTLTYDMKSDAIIRLHYDIQVELTVDIFGDNGHCKIFETAYNANEEIERGTAMLFDSETAITLTAAECEHYRFIGWRIAGINGGALLVANGVYDGFTVNIANRAISFALNSDLEIEAHFIEQVQVTVGIIGDGSVTVTNAATLAPITLPATLDINTPIRLLATKTGDYPFSHWSWSGGGDNENPRTILLSHNMDIVATFAYLPTSDGCAGDVVLLSEGVYRATATGPYCKFKNWTNAATGEVISTRNPFDIRYLPTGMPIEWLVANFYIPVCEILVFSSDITLGTASVVGTTFNGLYLWGTLATLTATPRQNARFVGWYRDNEFVSDNPRLNTVVLIKSTYEARFE